VGSATYMRRPGSALLWGTFAILLFAATLLVGCGDRNEGFIQGNWLYSEPSVGGVTVQSAVHTYWTFSRGRVSAHSCCDFRPGMTGRYRILQSEGDALTLELYELEGGTDVDTYQIEVGINRDRDTLTIQAVGPFSRDVP
jgi:hypothetical protein